MPNPFIGRNKIWNKHIQALNGYSIRLNLQSHVLLYTDASKLAFGGHSPLFLKNIVAAGMFNEQEKGTSSAERERELTAIHHALQSYKKDLKCKKSVLSGNQGACKILAAGSRKPHLQCLAVKIFKLEWHIIIIPFI